MKEKNNRACTLYESGLQFVDGFEIFFKKVSEYKLKMGIATSSVRQTLNNAKDQLKLERFFGNHIYDIAKVNHRHKPDPAIYLLAAEKLGVDPKRCLALEDSPCGVTSAQNAGMFCIGIDTAGAGEKIAHADLVVQSYEEINLPKILKERG